MRLVRRLHYWLNRRRMAESLREEIEAHRAMREADLLEKGVANPEAASKRVLGNVLLAREDVADAWSWPWLEGFLRDAKFTLRWMWRRPGFTTTCVATIAVGTGALASVLSVVHVVLLRAAPYPNHDRIVQVVQVSSNGALQDEISSVDASVLREMGAFEASSPIQNVTTSWTSSVSVTIPLAGSLPERAQMAITDSRAFAMLGTAPQLGRLPTPADDAPDAAPVAVIGHRLWTQRFAATPDVVGIPLKVDGRTYTIVGVMPAGFRFPAPYWVGADLWLLRSSADPSGLTAATRQPNLLGFALLTESSTFEQAQQMLDRVATALNTRFPADGQIGLRLVPYGETLRNEARSRLLLMLGAALVVLLIVCVNVVNLMLGRSIERHHEMAARAALGAGRARLVRQLVTETIVLFSAGGVCGVGLAVWGSRAIVAMRSYDIPRMEDAVVNAPVVAMTLGAVFIAALVAGTIISLQSTSRARLGLDAAGVRGSSEGRRWRGVQRALVATEITLALVLLFSAGILVEGARAQSHVTMGFDAESLVHARLDLPRERYATAAAQRDVLTRLVDALGAIPGVRSATTVDVPPGVGGSNARAVSLDTDPLPAGQRDLRAANVRIADSHYFETLGLSARAGRLFAPQDSDAARVAVVNEAFVARHFEGQSAVGRRIRVVLRGTPLEATPERTIIGVYPDIKETTLFEPTPPTVYLPIDARDATRMAVLVRTERPVGEMTRPIRAAIASVDPEQAAYGFMALAELVDSELSLNALNLRLLTTLGMVALVLSVIGVYGVTAQAVRQRAREIAIRLSLGTTPAAVKWLLWRECSRLILIGFVAGGVAGSLGAGWIRSLMHGINSTSPLTFVLAAAVLATAVLAGCYVPARRAARTDPALVLRGD